MNELNEEESDYSNSTILPIWKCFDKLPNGKRKCKFCTTEYAKSGSSLNLKNHVKTKRNTKY